MPPVHWEQLYDMDGAWNDRLHSTPRRRIEQQAAEGRDFSCEAIYLDPGWDTAFGTFLWGEKWLGPRKAFIDEMQSKYGLKVSLHCPLATWMSAARDWGNSGGVDLSARVRRIRRRRRGARRATVPAVLRNGPVQPGAAAGGQGQRLVAIYGGNGPSRIAHLNDGWYGNNSSWIPAKMPAWAEIDLGDGLLDRRGPAGQRPPGTIHRAGGDGTADPHGHRVQRRLGRGTWHEAARYRGAAFTGTKCFAFPAAGGPLGPRGILKREGEGAAGRDRNLRGAPIAERCERHSRSSRGGPTGAGIHRVPGLEAVPRCGGRAAAGQLRRWRRRS